MPFDSNGNASLVPGYLAVTGQDILPSQHNPPLEDIASMLSQVVLRSGVAPMGGSLNFSGFKATNLGVATGDGDAVPKSQMDEAISDVEGQIQAINKVLSTKVANYEAVDDDFNKVLRFTAAATLSIEDAADLRENWTCEIWSEGGDLLIDPSASQTVNGLTTLILQKGQRAEIFRTSATTFFANVTSDAMSGAQIQGYLYGLRSTRNTSDTANDIDIAAGAAASDISPFSLMQLGASLTKRIDANWSVGTGQGGLDTGSVANSTYYVWLIQRPDTGVVDALFSLSSTSPTMPSNYTRKRLIGKFTRAASANGYPTNDLNMFISAPQAIALGGAPSLTHGLGAPPSRASLQLVCVTTDLGYSAGAIIEYPPWGLSIPSISAGVGITVEINATSIILGYPLVGIYIRNKSAGNGTYADIDPSRWVAVVRAWP